MPAYSVVVPGSIPGKDLPDGTPGPGLYCAVIVKQVDEKTRSKTSINDLHSGASLESLLRQRLDATGGDYELTVRVSGEPFFLPPG